MNEKPVLIAGGGIAGLSLALTLHNLGVNFIVFEASQEMKPLGVGINIQPNAVRELFDMGITVSDMDGVGVPVKEWALVGLNGREVYSEPRGCDAGYLWPQYAAHRGDFHLLLYRKLVERAGVESVRLGHSMTSYTNLSDGSVLAEVQKADGQTAVIEGSLLFGADGIHSNIRKCMHPDQPPIHWGGTLMWRGVTRGKVFRTDSSFVGLGTHKHRIVIYPISKADENGYADINWIAELTYEDSFDWTKSGWFRSVPIESFASHFEGFKQDWVDFPALLRGAKEAYENPMIDRDPLDFWVDGSVALIGDAAHAMYPTGSNGASQSIIDARVIGKLMLQHGVTQTCLRAYDDEVRDPINALILRNRGSGPFGLLDMVDERCGGVFDHIDDVIPEVERIEFMAAYQTAAGFARDKLNSAERTIPEGARI